MHPVNEKLIRRFVDEVINKQCLVIIDEVIHPDYVFRTPGQEIHGREELKALFAGYHAAFPDLYVKIDDLVSTEQKVVLIFTLTGTHENELMGIPATEKQVKINGMTCSHIENGQIIQEWELLDQLTMFQQLDIISI